MSSSQPPLLQEVASGRSLVTYSEPWESVSNNRGAMLATDARARHFRSPGSARGSGACLTNDADFRSCWLCDSRVWRRTSDATSYAPEAGTSHCSASTHRELDWALLIVHESRTAE